MKIVFLNLDGTLVEEVIKNAEEIIVDGNNIEWSTGRSRGISVPFYVVSDDFVVNQGDPAPSNLPQADQKSKFNKIDLMAEVKRLKEENEQLKQQQLDQDMSIVALFESIIPS